MELPVGEYQLGPETGRLLAFTRCAGLAAAAGHDLTLEFTQWSARVVVGEDVGRSTVSVEVELGQLSVVEGHGGAKPLTDKDRVEIAKNAAKSLRSANHPKITFTASAAEGSGEAGTVHGELTLNGQTQPLDLNVTREPDGTYRAIGHVQQTAFGLKPFSAMAGALKVADVVDIEASGTLLPG